MQLDFDTMYNAILQKNPTYEGSFITCVKTTGIFCRPACTARKPKRENVEFVDTCNAAIKKGYRACKVCKPLIEKGTDPNYIISLIKDLEKDPFLRIKDVDLRKRNLNPVHIRRWFKVNHNMTFQAYQRMLRINHSYSELSEGKKVAETAYRNGFESISGFKSSFQNVFGDQPENKSKAVINIKRITTPMGPMFVCASKKGLCLLEFTDRRMLETEFEDLNKRLNAVILPGTNEHIEETEKQLLEYFEGERKYFDLPLDAPTTPFRQSVWEELLKIPYGETRSYKQQAIGMNNVKAIRAVASANGQNRIAIIIPCHRVVGSDGSLTGYAGGLARKKWLLDHERKTLGLPSQMSLF